MSYIKITFPDGRDVGLVEQSRIYGGLVEGGLEGLGRMDHGSFMNISYKGKLTPGVETRLDSLEEKGFKVEYKE